MLCRHAHPPTLLRYHNDWAGPHRTSPVIRPCCTYSLLGPVVYASRPCIGNCSCEPGQPSGRRSCPTARSFPSNFAVPDTSKDTLRSNHFLRGHHPFLSYLGQASEPRLSSATFQSCSNSPAGLSLDRFPYVLAYLSSVLSLCRLFQFSVVSSHTVPYSVWTQRQNLGLLVQF